MVKEKSKEKIMAWLDSIIALHKKQHIVVDGLELDLIEFRCAKEIQLKNAHLVADALEKKPIFEKRNCEEYPYKSYFMYKGYKFFSVLTEIQYKACCISK